MRVFHPMRPRRLCREQKAVAAIEFALLAPVMVGMFFGVVEISNVMRAQAKLNVAAGQFVSMIAAQNSVTEGTSDRPGGSLGDFCTAASYNMLPFGTGMLSGYVGSLTVVPVAGVPTLMADWVNDKACPANNAVGSIAETSLLTNIANSPQSVFTADGVPSGSGGTLVTGYTAIVAQLTYSYSNVATHFLGTTVTLNAVAIARPRANVAVTCSYPSGNSSVKCAAVY